MREREKLMTASRSWWETGRVAFAERKGIAGRAGAFGVMSSILDLMY